MLVGIYNVQKNNFLMANGDVVKLNLMLIVMKVYYFRHLNVI